METGIVLIGSSSSHGGVVITGCRKTHCCGTLVSRIGDYHQCPIQGHGTTRIIGPIIERRPIIEGQYAAKIGDITECGAIITTGCEKTRFGSVDI